MRRGASPPTGALRPWSRLGPTVEAALVSGGTGGCAVGLTAAGFVCAEPAIIGFKSMVVGAVP